MPIFFGLASGEHAREAVIGAGGHDHVALDPQRERAERAHRELRRADRLGQAGAHVLRRPRRRRGRSLEHVDARALGGARAGRLRDDRRGGGRVGEREALERRRGGRKRRSRSVRRSRPAPTPRCAAPVPPAWPRRSSRAARRRRPAQPPTTRRASRHRGRLRGAETRRPRAAARCGRGRRRRSRRRRRCRPRRLRARCRSRPRRRPDRARRALPTRPRPSARRHRDAGRRPPPGPGRGTCRTALPSGSGERCSCWTSVTVGRQRHVAGRRPAARCGARRARDRHRRLRDGVGGQGAAVGAQRRRGLGDRRRRRGRLLGSADGGAGDRRGDERGAGALLGVQAARARACRRRRRRRAPRAWSSSRSRAARRSPCPAAASPRARVPSSAQVGDGRAVGLQGEAREVGAALRDRRRDAHGRPHAAARPCRSGREREQGRRDQEPAQTHPRQSSRAARRERPWTPVAVVCSIGSEALILAVAPTNSRRDAWDGPSA